MREGARGRRKALLAKLGWTDGEFATIR